MLHKKESKLLFVYLLILLFFQVTEQLDMQCNRDLDCNDPIKCAYCIKGKCEIIDKNVFENSLPCKLNEHNCEAGYCNPNQRRVLKYEGYGECVCYCDSDYFYGKRCMSRDARKYKHYPSGFNFITPLHVEFNQPAPLIIIVSTGPSPILIIHDTTGGYIARLEEPVGKNKDWKYEQCKEFLEGFYPHYLSPSDVCPFSAFIESESLVYVSRFEIPFDFVTSPGEKITSFVQKIQLDTFHPTFLTKLSEHTHFYHTNYPEHSKLTSTPIIRFNNCGKNLTFIKKHKYKDKIHLDANVFYVSDSYSLISWPELRVYQKLEFKWEAFRIEGDTSKRQNIYDYHFEELWWDIKPRHWVGMFVIKLTVTGHFFPLGKKIRRNEIKESNYNQCFLEVLLSPLVAVITGGSMRFAFREHSLKLDASKSIDPNSPGDISDMEFTITCNWTKEAVCEQHTIDGEESKPIFIIEAMKLQSKKAYNFTLEVGTKKDKNLKPAFAHQIIVVGELELGKHFIEDFKVDCIYNCEPKTNPKDIVYLRVGGLWNNLYPLAFEWVQYVFENGIGKEIALDSVRQSDTPSFICIINEDTLKENTYYEFKVTYKNTSQFVVYPITTTLSSSSECTIDPKTGVAGLTRFKLTCQILSDSIKSFELYDKFRSDDPGFSGRMITNQETGDIEEFVLTRGLLEIISFDDYGTATVNTVNVILTRSNQTVADIEQKLVNLEKISSVLSVGASLRTASVISDLLNSSLSQDNEEKIPTILESLVIFLSSLSIKRYHDAKLGISTLHIVLLAARKSLGLRGVWHAAKTINTLSKALVVGLKEGHHCTFQELYKVFRHFLDCLYIVLEIKENYLDNRTMYPHYYNPVIYTTMKEISQFILKSLIILQTALSYRHLPAQNHKLIESSLGNLSMWIKVDVPMALSKYTQTEHHSNMFPAIIPDDLAKDVEEMGFYLALQVISFSKDPTLLKRTNTRSKLDVFLCFKENVGQTCNYPKILKNGILVAFDISNIVSQMEFTNITLKRLDKNLKSENLDKDLPVYKLNPLPLANVEAQFRFNSNNTELLVLAERNIRPTYDLLVKENNTVTPTSSLYPVVANPYGKFHLYYLAIQPGPQVAVNTTVSFDIKLYSKMCYTWHNLWGNRGCQPINEPGTSALICECNRLSLIGGFVEEVTYSLEVVEDFPMYLTPLERNDIRLILPLILLLFLLIALVCRKSDRHDKLRRFVSILPDNFPGETYGFLVRVVTGARLGAGTDAAVGVKIYGKTNNSRNHILSNDSFNVLEGMGEDWFLIYEPESLGKITFIDVWHNNSGVKGDWFCDSVTIYDLHHNDCYFFNINEWITYSLKRFPHVTVFPAELSIMTSRSKIFIDYIKSGFQLSHLWIDTIVRHPNDPVSRTDRLVIIVCYLLVSMAVSLIIIVKSDSFIEVDDFSYSVTWLMVVSSIYACISASTIAFILMHMFRRVYKIIFHTEHPREKMTDEEKTRKEMFQVDYLSLQSTTYLMGNKNYIHYSCKHNPKSTYSNRTLAESINLTLMPKPLVPVQLIGDEPNVIINKKWLLCTSVTVIAILAICIYLNMTLYKYLPPVKTMKWFTIFGFSIIIHAIILQPLKIILTSIVLAVAFKKIIYKDVYTFDPNDGLQLEHYGNLKYLVNLLHLRSKRRYCPLSEVCREDHRKKIQRAKQWRMIYAFFVQIMFLIVLGKLLETQIPTLYQTNTHLRTLMKDVGKLYNTTDLKHFQHHCGFYLFKYIWYNWNILSQGSENNFFRKDWMYDSVSRVVGKVRLRQFRVKPGYCKASVDISLDCAAPFSLMAEDSREYFPFWIGQVSNETKEKYFGFEYLSKWYFLWPSDDSNFYIGGITEHTYPSGGYTWDLGSSIVEMDGSLTKLWEEGWIDHFTRAVLQHVHVYNVNTRLFSEIVLVTEQSTAGQIFLAIVVHSVNTNVQLDWWLTLFIFFTFMLCVRVFIMTNFVGVLGLFRNWRRPYELFMTVNAIAVLFFLLLHFLTVPHYVKEYLLHPDELQFFDFYKTAHYSYTARALLYTLYVLNLIRFYSLWRFGKTVLRIFLAIVISMKHLLWLTGMSVLLQLLLYRYIGYLFLIFIDICFNSNMVYKRNYSYFHSTNEMSHYQILFFIMNSTIFMIMMCFVIVLAYEYKAVRNELTRYFNIENYLLFIRDEIIAMWKKRTDHSNKTQPFTGYSSHVNMLRKVFSE